MKPLYEKDSELDEKITEKMFLRLKTFLKCIDSNLIFVLGISNTAGTFAAILGTVGTGFFVELVGSFQGFLLLTSLLYFLAAIFYNLFSTGERVNFDEPGKHHIRFFLFF